MFIARDLYFIQFLPIFPKVSQYFVPYRKCMNPAFVDSSSPDLMSQ